MDDATFQRDFAHDLAGLAEGPPLLLEIPAEDAWLLFSCLQLVLRHPGLPDLTRSRMERVARSLECAVAVTPALREMARRGWDPTYDE